MPVRLAMLTALLALSATSTAFASTIDLTFEGIASPANPNPAIGNYYNGGAGPNYGITFSSNALAICLNTTTVNCSNTSRGGLGDPNSQGGGLFFLSGSSTYLDDAAGFTTGFSLNYTAVSQTGSLGVYSGLDGTGTLLATLNLALTSTGSCSGYNAPFCPFVPVGVAFTGTAESIAFSGVANQIVFDDVTFGSTTPGPSPAPGVTPEPSSIALLLTGVGALGSQLRRRIKSSV